MLAGSLKEKLTRNEKAVGVLMTLLMRSVESTSPPVNGTVAPVVPVPRPRATRGIRYSLQIFMIATTSS